MEKNKKTGKKNEKLYYTTILRQNRFHFFFCNFKRINRKDLKLLPNYYSGNL